MDMEFGMPALIELSGLEENARLCNTLGLKFIELNMNLPEYQIECLKNRKAFQDISHKYGVYYTIHLDENLNISDFNPVVTKAHSDTVKQVIEIAKEVKIPLLNMHMNEGVYFTLPDRKIFLLEKYEDIYLKNILDFRNCCEEWVGTDDIVIAIENTGGYFDFQKKAVNLLLESPVFVLTWDIGHSHSAGEGDEAYIMQREQKLKHFHVHDANGKQNHLVLGTGEIDLIERLEVAGRNHCRCVIETKTAEALWQSCRWLETHFK